MDVEDEGNFCLVVLSQYSALHPNLTKFKWNCQRMQIISIHTVSVCVYEALVGLILGRLQFIRSLQTDPMFSSSTHQAL